MNLLFSLVRSHSGIHPDRVRIELMNAAIQYPCKISIYAVDNDKSSQHCLTVVLPDLIELV